MTLPATIRLNSRATTASYAAGFAPKNVASTETPNERLLAEASPRSVVVGTMHLACAGSCWHVFSPGVVVPESLPPPPHAPRARAASAAVNLETARIRKPDGCPDPTGGWSRR